MLSWKAPAEGLWQEPLQRESSHGDGPRRSSKGKGRAKPGVRALRERSGVRKPGTVLAEVPGAGMLPRCVLQSGPGGLTLPCSAALSAPWWRVWPFPLISDCCLGNLLQLFPGIWICLFSKENKRKTRAVALGRAFLGGRVISIVELLPFFQNLCTSDDCMEHKSSW